MRSRTSRRTLRRSTTSRCRGERRTAHGFARARAHGSRDTRTVTCRRPAGTPRSCPVAPPSCRAGGFLAPAHSNAASRARVRSPKINRCAMDLRAVPPWTIRQGVSPSCRRQPRWPGGRQSELRRTGPLPPSRGDRSLACGTSPARAPACTGWAGKGSCNFLQGSCDPDRVMRLARAPGQPPACQGRLGHAHPSAAGTRRSARSRSAAADRTARS